MSDERERRGVRVRTLRSRGRRALRTAVRVSWLVLLVAAIAGQARVWGSDDELLRRASAEPMAAPVPSASPGLALSDKPPSGCCCIRHAETGKGGCSSGLQEDKCRTAGAVFPKSKTVWVAGPCPGQ